MSMLRLNSWQLAVRAAALVVVSCVLAAWMADAYAGNNGLFTQRGVGGVDIDAQGQLTLVTDDVRARMIAERRKLIKAASKDMNGTVKTRKVSLRRLEEFLVKHHRQIPVPDFPEEVSYLGGLQRIQYVLVYPEENDIVLVGPAEGWQVADDGAVVGVTTGRPVLQLDDLLVALRTARDARKRSLSCSIDPTKEGLDRVKALVPQLGTVNAGRVNQVVQQIELALGPQMVSVHGLPANTHFARVMVAADYHMKRLAMGLERPPVAGLPDYMALLKQSPRGVNDMLPRWWLAADFQPVLKDPDGMAWEIPASGVKCVTETDFLAAGGVQRGAGQASAQSRQWAKNMTAKYAELAEKNSVFADLRNCMDLAIVGALIFKEDMPGKAGLPLQFLLNERELLYDVALNPPRRIATQARAVKKGKGWLISASGGVEIDSWRAVEKSEVNRSLTTVHKAAAAKGDAWWWN